jgi:hypothetical protein
LPEPLSVTRVALSAVAALVVATGNVRVVTDNTEPSDRPSAFLAMAQK